MLTEVILLTSRFTKTPNIEKLFFANTVIERTERVCDHGVNLDKSLSLTHHINETCRKAANTIRSIGLSHSQINQQGKTQTVS